MSDSTVVMRPASVSRARRWASLCVLLFAQLVIGMDFTVLNVAFLVVLVAFALIGGWR